MSLDNIRTKHIPADSSLSVRLAPSLDAVDVIAWSEIHYGDCNLQPDALRS
jgi:hypothetical protein